MVTKVLNSEVCGFRDFVIIGSKVCGYDNKNKRHVSHIKRVIVVQDATTEERSLLLGRPIMHWNVDFDILLEDGSTIEVNTSSEHFIRKMSKYVWEFQKRDPRAVVPAAKVEKKKVMTDRDREMLVILTQQLDAERLIQKHLIKERDELSKEYSWDDIATQKKQRQCLASEQRILNLQTRIDKLHEKED